MILLIRMGLYYIYEYWGELIGSLIIFLFDGELKFVLEKWILMLDGDSHIVKATT